MAKSRTESIADTIAFQILLLFFDDGLTTGQVVKTIDIARGRLAERGEVRAYSSDLAEKVLEVLVDWRLDYANAQTVLRICDKLVHHILDDIPFAVHYSTHVQLSKDPIVINA